jgi:serine phosphatase RsbU (regulator of sigma subunit)
VGVARSYKNLGLIYLKQHMLFEANQKFLDALAIFRAVELKGDIVDCLNNLGHIHIKQNQKNKAKTYFEESKELSRVIKSEPNLVVAYSGMAICYSEQNDNLAIAYANKAFLGAESLGIIEVLVESSATLMKAYERQNRLKKALHYAYLNKNFSDSLLNAKQIKQLTRMEVEFEHQQIEKELKALQEKENIAHAIAIAKQKHIKRIYFIVSIALLLLVIFVYREFLIKRRAIKIQNQKNKIISSQNKDLIQQREEILTQRDVLSKQQREINSSISYASKIQNALLPKSKIIKELLPEHFILFKPCEAVSGDFYFFEKVNGKTIIVCADCTGHGVPGGMLSMLGIAFLRDIVKSERLLSADVILNKLRERFKQALDQKGIIGEAKDGIDMSLCIFDSALNKLQYAGAHSPFYLIRNDTLEIFKGDKQPVGVHYKETLFVSHDIQLQEGDVFYLSTDGFRDQMGGAHSKRFSSKQFNDLLEAIHTEPMFKQYDSLIRALEKWRGKNEATDDVLVMGFRIS